MQQLLDSRLWDSAVGCLNDSLVSCCYIWVFGNGTQIGIRVPASPSICHYLESTLRRNQIFFCSSKPFPFLFTCGRLLNTQLFARDKISYRIDHITNDLIDYIVLCSTYLDHPVLDRTMGSKSSPSAPVWSHSPDAVPIDSSVHQALFKCGSPRLRWTASLSATTTRGPWHGVIGWSSRWHPDNMACHPKSSLCYNVL